MLETTNDEDAISRERVNELLKGVPEELHELLRAIGGDSNEIASDDIEAARRVSVQSDGAVIVMLTMDVKVKNEPHARFRLRPLKARDYFDGTYGEDAEDPTMMASLRFGSRLAHPAGIVDELRCPRDMKAAYFGVLALRKNFSSPRT